MLAHRRSRPAAWLSSGLALLAAVALVACGGAGGDAAVSSEDSPAPILAATTVVVTADVDADGVNDVLEVPLDGAGTRDDTRCWRGRPDGSFEPVAGGSEHPGVDAIRDDLRRRPDQDILSDEGAHRAPVEGTSALPYAVLHLERNAAADGERALGDPLIDGLHPEAGRAGALVGITGDDLAAPGEGTTVQFDDLEARVLVALRRFVLVVVPAQAPLGDVELVVTRGVTPSLAATFTVLEAPTPVLESVEPAPLVAGVLAILRGSYLGTPIDDVAVTFGGVSAKHVLSLGTKVFVEVPELAASGACLVTVNGIVSNALQVEVAAELDAPRLSGVTPTTASAGSLVRIRGDDLFVIGERPRVSFGSAAALVFGYEAGALIAIVPATADGPIRVSVGGRGSNELAFTLRKRGVPTITALEPSSVEAGAVIDIRGTDLYDLSGLGPNALPSALRGRLPVVTFDDQRSWFVFPTVGGLRALVPFRTAPGTIDVVVRLGDTTSDPAPLVVK